MGDSQPPNDDVLTGIEEFTPEPESIIQIKKILRRLWTETVQGNVVSLWIFGEATDGTKISVQTPAENTLAMVGFVTSAATIVGQMIIGNGSSLSADYSDLDKLFYDVDDNGEDDDEHPKARR